VGSVGILARSQVTLQQAREILHEKIKQAAQLEKEIESLVIAIPLLMEEHEK
jgi:hypothetical protein